MPLSFSLLIYYSNSVDPLEALFFRRLTLTKNPQLIFLSRQKIKNDLLFMIIEQTKERFVSPTFQSCNTCTVSFDLWI